MKKTLSTLSLMDIEEAFRGKLWTFVPVINRGFYALGVAIISEAGYSPVPFDMYVAESYGDAKAHANKLNELRGMTEREALLIIGTTMKPIAPPNLAAIAAEAAQEVIAGVE